MNVLKGKLVAGINAICNSAAKFSQCCPRSGAWRGVKRRIVSVDDLSTAQTYPVVLLSGKMVGIINFNVKKNNSLCPKGTKVKTLVF